MQDQKLLNPTLPSLFIFFSLKYPFNADRNAAAFIFKNKVFSHSRNYLINIVIIATVWTNENFLNKYQI